MASGGASDQASGGVDAERQVSSSSKDSIIMIMDENHSPMVLSNALSKSEIAFHGGSPREFLAPPPPLSLRA